jgi:hypothetical protein
MSGESAVHVRLVERLIALVRNRHQPPRGLLLLADHPDFGRDRPQTIGGFLPDVFASDLPVTFEVIGEAKTFPDLETDRSLRQIAAFLDYLAVRPGSAFYLTVPPFTAVRARTILRGLLQPHHGAIRIEVHDGLD